MAKLRIVPWKDARDHRGRPRVKAARAINPMRPLLRSRSQAAALRNDINAPRARASGAPRLPPLRKAIGSSGKIGRAAKFRGEVGSRRSLSPLHLIVLYNLGNVMQCITAAGARIPDSYAVLAG